MLLALLAMMRCLPPTLGAAGIVSASGIIGVANIICQRQTSFKNCGATRADGLARCGGPRADAGNKKAPPNWGGAQTVEKPCHSEPVRTLAWESPGF